MPRFFFDVEDRGRCVTDDLGMDLDNLAAAMCEATSLSKLLALEGRLISRPGLIRVTITEQVSGSRYEIVLDCGRG